MPYRDSSNGTRDTRPMTLYGYTFNLSSSKTVKSITLPNNRNVVVLAMNLSSDCQTRCRRISSEHVQQSMRGRRDER